MKTQILTTIGVLLAAILLLPIDPSTTWEPCRLFTTDGFLEFSYGRIVYGHHHSAELSLFIRQTVFVGMMAVFIVNVPWRWRKVLRWLEDRPF